MSSYLQLEEEPWVPTAPFAVYLDNGRDPHRWNLIQRFENEADARFYCEQYSSGGRLIEKYEIKGT